MKDKSLAGLETKDQAEKSPKRSRCPFLTGKYEKICRAVGFLLEPSREHLEEYCESDNYLHCNTYRMYFAGGKRHGIRRMTYMRRSEEAENI